METKEIFVAIFVFAGLIGGIAYLVVSIWEFIEDLCKSKYPAVVAEVERETLIFIPNEVKYLPAETIKSLEDNFHNVQFIHIPLMKNKLEIWCYTNEKLIETLEIA